MFLFCGFWLCKLSIWSFQTCVLKKAMKCAVLLFRLFYHCAVLYFVTLAKSRINVSAEVFIKSMSSSGRQHSRWNLSDTKTVESDADVIYSSDAWQTAPILPVHRSIFHSVVCTGPWTCRMVTWDNLHEWADMQSTNSLRRQCGLPETLTV